MGRGDIGSRVIARERQSGTDRRRRASGVPALLAFLGALFTSRSVRLRFGSPRADGSVDGFARQWLTFDPRKARALG